MEIHFHSHHPHSASAFALHRKSPSNSLSEEELVTLCRGIKINIQNIQKGRQVLFSWSVSGAQIYLPVRIGDGANQLYLRISGGNSPVCVSQPRTRITSQELANCLARGRGRRTSNRRNVLMTCGRPPHKRGSEFLAAIIPILDVRRDTRTLPSRLLSRKRQVNNLWRKNRC